MFSYSLYMYNYTNTLDALNVSYISIEIIFIWFFITLNGVVLFL